MIDFTGIEKWSLGYEIAHLYVSYMHNCVFYRKMEVVGAENLPEEPFLIVSNHQNGLNDALLPIMGLGKYRMVFIARGDIFKIDAVAKFLKSIRILPAYRVRDTGKENLGENDKIFNLAAEILNDGNIVGLFPEAALQYKRAEGNFKKGFARIAFLAEEKCDFKTNLKIVPMANYYTNFKNMGYDILLNIGKPFTFEELYDVYREHPEAGLRQLALKAQEQVRPLMLDMQDPANFEQLDFVRDMYYLLMRNEGKCGKNIIDRLHLEQDMVLKFKALKENDTQKFEAFIAKVSDYMQMMKKLNFRDWLIGRKLNFGGLFGKSVLAAISTPFFAIFWLLTALPYYIAELVKMKDKRMTASLRMGISVLGAYPVWFLILFGLSFIIPWAWWCSFVFLFAEIIIVPYMAKTMNFMLRFYKKLHHSWRYFSMLGKNKNLKTAIETKSSIVEDLKKL